MLKSFQRHESGNTAILFALALPVLIAVAGTAIMFIERYRTKTGLQSALDSAVLAGTALGASAKDKERIEIAQAIFDVNYRGLAEFHSGSSDYSVSGSKAPKFSVLNLEVRGTADATIDNPFRHFTGTENVDVSTSAAAVKIESDPVCILGLNPQHKETLDMTGQAKLNAPECAVMANSNSGSGMNQKGKPYLNSKQIGVTGNYTGDGYSTDPISGAAPIGDPFAALPFPSKSNCDYTDTKHSNVTVTIDPGVYCGGLRVVANAVVTLKPGNYVFRDGPLWINGGGSVYGRDVLLAFTGPDASLYMEGSSSLDVTSPSSGTYINMQFMQEPNTGGDDLWFAVVGNNTLRYDGVLYAPTQDVWFGGGSIIDAKSPNYAIVADKIWIQDQSVVNVSYVNSRNLPIEGADGFRYGARLTR